MTARGRRQYAKHGVHAAEKALSKRGLSALDGRSREARMVKEWASAIEGDLGGRLPQAKQTILGLASTDLVLIALADEYIKANPSKLIVGRGGRRAFIALIEQRGRLADRLVSRLTALGLERKAKELVSASALIRGGADDARNDEPERTEQDTDTDASVSPRGEGASGGASTATPEDRGERE